MRIIAGEWRGRVLIAPKGETTRPTSDRTREALFSMLVSRLGSLRDLSVADLFAGSGALGLEALSRGSAHCLFVEQDRLALDALRRNVDALGASNIVDIRAQSVMAIGPATQQMDIILLDPPYGTGAGSVALDKWTRLGWIAPGAYASVETARDEQCAVKGFVVDSERAFGKAKLTLLRYEP